MEYISDIINTRGNLRKIRGMCSSLVQEKKKKSSESRKSRLERRETTKSELGNTLRVDGK